MKRIFLIILQIAFVFAINAQSYSINYFQSSYDTLINYNSVNIELGLAGEDPYYWEKTFDFGFDFPFYDEIFTEVNIDSDGVGYFPQSPEYNLFMFAGSYVIGEILDTSYLFSEVRYEILTSNNLEALVLEYHNVYVDDEYDENGANHSINFQIWFYENGIIELRFGNIDLANCSYYFPGQGFSFDNQNPTGEIYGPFISINNNDISESACFFGNHLNPMTMYDDDDNCGVLTSIPPEGFVVQFSPTNILSTNEIQNGTTCNFKVTQLNHGLIKIYDELNSFKSCYVYDLMGREIKQSKQNEFHINFNSTQILIFQIEGECGREVHKLMVRKEN